VEAIKLVYSVVSVDGDIANAEIWSGVERGGEEGIIV